MLDKAKLSQSSDRLSKNKSAATLKRDLLLNTQLPKNPTPPPVPPLGMEAGTAA
jgi:hypothetical protein